MRLVVPYVPEMLHPETSLLDAEYVDVSGSDTAYAELLMTLWEGGERFCIVEHDIIPTARDIEYARQCPKEWCAASYQYGGEVPLTAFGLVAFSPSALPPLPDDVRLFHWQELAPKVMRLLGDKGYSWHDHFEVRHRA